MAFRSDQVSPVAPPDAVGMDKWRLASQLQKAIRHGRPDAAKWAVAQLETVDPNYLRYRLSVIAAEDVAAAEAQSVAAAFSEGWGKKAVAARGGVGFLLDLAQVWAKGVKDRTPCNWMACSYWLADFEQVHGPWSSLGSARAQELAFDRSLSWWERGLGGWRAAGTKRFPNDGLPQVEGDWQAWKEACSEFACDPVVAMVMSAGEHQREAHPVFLGLAMAERNGSDALIVRPNLPDLPDLGPWLSATFDKHTADGKRAYRRWLATHHEASHWLTDQGLDEEGRLDAVGRLAFWLEGGQCDQQWEYPVSKAILFDTKKRYLQHRNMNPHTFAKLCVDPLGWHQARLEVVQGLKMAANRSSLQGRPQ